MSETEPDNPTPLEPVPPDSESAEALGASQNRSSPGELSRESKRRVAANEAIYRELNEQLHALSGTQMSVYCECGNVTCSIIIAIKPTRYEDVRSDPLQFVLVPGHENPAVETVIDRHDEYVVVRKLRSAAPEIAQHTHRGTGPDAHA